MDEKDALLCLNAVDGLGPVRIRQLVDHYGSAREVIRHRARCRPFGRIPQAVVDSLRSFNILDFLASEHERIRLCGVSVYCPADEEYPVFLKNIHDAPPILYVWGDILVFRYPAVAVVGSRRCSIYGRQTATRLADELASHGVVVISGLARGIDAAAHRGALGAGGFTAAVLGSGLDAIYPSEHLDLARSIAEHGAVISEFPMATSARPGHFPRRNRIISGLSRGVVVVEATRRSGALLTAQFALEQGREVYAVPGKIDSPESYGPLGLIKEGAMMVCSAQDILEDLGVEPVTKLNPDFANEGFCDNLSGPSREIYACLTDEPVSIDEIVARTGQAVSDVLAGLLALECRRVIERVGPNRIARSAVADHGRRDGAGDHGREISYRGVANQDQDDQQDLGQAI